MFRIVMIVKMIKPFIWQLNVPSILAVDRLYTPVADPAQGYLYKTNSLTNGRLSLYAWALIKNRVSRKDESYEAKQMK
jgi:hypothetical protein